MQPASVYRLNAATGKWDIHGVGYVVSAQCCQGSESGKFLTLLVLNNDNFKKVFFHHHISPYCIYRRQEEDRMISWLDPQLSTELAISFPDSTSCSFIWDRICAAQKKNLQLKNVEKLPPERIIPEVVPEGLCLQGSVQRKKSAISSDPMHRAGVYRLNPDTRKWDNHGAGSVFSVEFCKGSDYNLSFYVINNDNYEIIFFHRFSPAYDYVYGRGGERIISWLDPQFSTKLALSFRESTDCSFIWDRICAAQKRNLQLKNVENGTHPPSESLETSKTSHANVCGEEAGPSKPDTLPPERIIREVVPGGPGSGTGRGNGASERFGICLPDSLGSQVAGTTSVSACDNGRLSREFNRVMN